MQLSGGGGGGPSGITNRDSDSSSAEPEGKQQGKAQFGADAFPLTLPKPVGSWGGKYQFKGDAMQSYLRFILGRFTTMRSSAAFLKYKLRVLEWEIDNFVGFSHEVFYKDETVKLMKADWRANALLPLAGAAAKVVPFDKATNDILGFLHKCAIVADCPENKILVTQVTSDCETYFTNLVEHKFLNHKAFVLAKLAANKAPEAGVAAAPSGGPQTAQFVKKSAILRPPPPDHHLDRGGSKPAGRFPHESPSKGFPRARGKGGPQRGFIPQWGRGRGDGRGGSYNPPPPYSGPVRTRAEPSPANSAGEPAPKRKVVYGLGFKPDQAR